MSDIANQPPDAQEPIAALPVEDPAAPAPAAAAPPAIAAPLPVAPPKDESPRPIPVWASLLVILLCLGGGGWIMHWYVMTDALSHESKLLDPATAPPDATRVRPTAAARNAMAPAQPVNQPAVRKQDENLFWVHAPEAAMLVDTHTKPPVIKVINYTSYEFVPQETRTLIISARRIARDDAVAKNLGLNDEQVNKMRTLTGQIGMVTDPADMESLKTLWTTYDAAASKPAAEAAMVQGLTAIARKSVDPTKQAAADRGAKIKAVLTDDQWKKFDAMGR
jgi:hypothetical protein